MDNAAARELSLTLISAENLPSLRKFGEMKVYARVEFKGQQNKVQKTPTDKEGQTNPTWDFAVKYTVSEEALPQSVVEITLHCRCTLGSDKYVGQVIIPLRNLFDMGMTGTCTFPVVGTREGRIHILYRFGERIAAAVNSNEEPAASSSSSSAGWKQKAKKIVKESLAEETKIAANLLVYELMDYEDEDQGDS